MPQDVLRVIAPANPSIPEAGPAFSFPALFWRARYLDDSAFLFHLPFLFWLIDAARPQRYVELGVGSAVSYFAACQALDKLVPNARCFGIDNWIADSGKSAVPGAIRWRNTELYSDFSDLTIGKIEEFHEKFGTSSIDLLVINSEISEDFISNFRQNWTPALSNCAVVLIHGVNSHCATGHGKEFLDELSSSAPTITFEKGEGLAAILWGKERNEELLKFVELLSGEEGRGDLRQIFARLGAAHNFEWLSRHEVERSRETRKALSLIEKAHAQQSKVLSDREAAYDERGRLIAGLQSTVFDLQRADEKKAEAAELAAALDERFHEIAALTNRLNESDGNLSKLNAEAADQRRKAEILKDKLDDSNAEVSKRFQEIAALTRQVGLHDSEIDRLTAELEVARGEATLFRTRIEKLKRTVSWRMTAPIRWPRRLVRRLLGFPV